MIEKIINNSKDIGETILKLFVSNQNDRVIIDNLINNYDLLDYDINRYMYSLGMYETISSELLEYLLIKSKTLNCYFEVDTIQASVAHRDDLLKLAIKYNNNFAPETSQFISDLKCAMVWIEYMNFEIPQIMSLIYNISSYYPKNNSVYLKLIKMYPETLEYILAFPIHGIFKNNIEILDKIFNKIHNLKTLDKIKNFAMVKNANIDILNLIDKYIIELEMLKME
jgi:hypothetical protein